MHYNFYVLWTYVWKIKALRGDGFIPSEKSFKKWIPDLYYYIIEFYIFLATNPEPRHCPFVGKFDIKNLIWTQRNAHALMKHIRQLDTRYFDQNYYSNKYSRSLYGERSRVMRRTKRLNQDIDCDNESFSSLVIGCISRDRMEFISKCSLPDLITCEYLLYKFVLCTLISFSSTM